MQNGRQGGIDTIFIRSSDAAIRISAVREEKLLKPRSIITGWKRCSVMANIAIRTDIGANEEGNFTSVVLCKSNTTLIAVVDNMVTSPVLDLL